jgi:hypothetical protein
LLVEAGFVAAILAVIAAAAGARMQRSPLLANERQAINTLDSVAHAQKALRSLCAIDCNFNGIGEFGYFGELLGTDFLRIDQVGGIGTTRLQPPLLSSRLGRVRMSRISTHSYIFQMYLPNTTAGGVAESYLGGAAGCCIDAANAERHWCCYAWPMSYGISGKRVFFVNESSQVLAADNSIWRYSGHVTIPSFTAAYGAATTGSLDCPTAANSLGRDGQRWTVLH